MASKIIGRKPCLLGCGFDSAHIKESEKCLYHFCPACGCNGPHARTQQQKDLMRKGMREEGAAKPLPEPEPTPTPTGAKQGPEPTPVVTPTPTPTPEKKPQRRGLFY